MTMSHDPRRTRTLQISFLVLLALCNAQLGWWLVDQVRYTGEMRDRSELLLEADITKATAALRVGMSRAAVQALYPDLQITEKSVIIKPEVLEQLDADRWHRLNRYWWEGAFFLAVLVGAMYVVFRALRDQAELHRRQESFLATVSHELKSPLASLRLSAETLSLRDPPSDRRAQLIERLLQDLARLERLIGNILDTSRLAEPAIRTSPELLVVLEEVRSAIADVTMQAAESKTTVTADVPASMAIYADRDAVRTVLSNLLQNAVRATAGGQVVVSARVSSGRARIDVRDNGTGFTPAQAAHLFEKFYRPHGASRGGTGLGLYLVRRYAQLDGGTVGASSEGPGCGACFTVEWPLADGGAA
ncbi:MAG: HAMP domain-containing histidine kinase [Gemmatimonadetes bacterium]|nr:HAMP domain-containing histidine kinase [Gemmatimonadota bacterium]